MKKIYTLVFSIMLIGYSLCINAQCDGRYIDKIFDEVSVETVTYSDVTGFEMDIYQPVGDEVNARPLMIFAHGGSFFGGSKNNITMKNICNHFAERGYVAASIQYNLTEAGLLIDSLHMIETVMKAIADGKSAVRYFRKSFNSGNPYGIDNNQIWFGGNSAGAILATHLAYIDEEDVLASHIQNIVDANGGLEGESGNLGYSSDVYGVVNLAGGLNDPTWISIDDEPLISCHGDLDGTVPYDCNDVFWSNPITGSLDLVDMCGSQVLHEHANAIGHDNALLVFEGEDHTPWSASPGGALETEMLNFVTTEVYNRLDCDALTSIEEDLKASISISPNPANDFVSVSLNDVNLTGKIMVYDIAGRVVNTISDYSKEFKIQREGLDAGMYLIQFNTVETSIVKKVIFK